MFGETKMQTYKKAIFFVLLATVLLSVSQAFTAPVNAQRINTEQQREKYEQQQNNYHDSCTHSLNVADPAQALLYDELLTGQVVSNDTSLCVP
jgi:hypothetical protein